MPTTLLYVNCSSFEKYQHHGNDDPVLHTLSTAAIHACQNIHRLHSFEDICLMSYDGSSVCVLQEFTSETDQLLNSIKQIQTMKYKCAKALNYALVEAYLHVQDAVGLHAPTQIIIFTDSSPLSDDIFQIRPQFQTKIHVFSCNLLLTSGESLSTTSESNNQSNYTIQLMKKFTNLSGGSLYLIDLISATETSQSTLQLEHCMQEFSKLHYDKYYGYLAFGHLISSIELHPDPHLILWGDSSDNEPVKVPPTLSIVGFIHNNHISSPICISKHTILQSEKKVVGKKRKKKRKRSKEYENSDIIIKTSPPQSPNVSHSINHSSGASSSTTSTGEHQENSSSNENNENVKIPEMATATTSVTPSKKTIIKADACKADPSDSSFFELLHNTLLKMKLCAIVHFYDRQYAYIGVAYETSHSALIMGILDQRAEQPWLKSGIHDIVSYSARDNFSNSRKQLEDDDDDIMVADNLFYRPHTPRIYDLYVKNNSSSIPLFKTETLQNDFQKIYRSIKTLPNKATTLFAECEKIVKISKVHLDTHVIATLISFLKEQHALLQQNQSGVTATPYLSVLIQQLEKKEPLKCPEINNGSESENN